MFQNILWNIMKLYLINFESAEPNKWFNMILRSLMHVFYSSVFIELALFVFVLKNKRNKIVTNDNKFQYLNVFEQI